MSSQYGQLGPLAAEIGLPVCIVYFHYWQYTRYNIYISANFNGFRVLATLLHRHRLTDVDQTLHNVWPSPGLVHYIYIFRGSCPLREFCQVQNSLCIQVLHSPILAALLHGTQAVGVSQTLWYGTRNRIKELYRGRHLYLAGRPSRWASAHILVCIIFLLFRCLYCMFATAFLKQ